MYFEQQSFVYSARQRWKCKTRKQLRLLWLKLSCVRFLLEAQPTRQSFCQGHLQGTSSEPKGFVEAGLTAEHCPDQGWDLHPGPPIYLLISVAGKPCAHAKSSKLVEASFLPSQGGGDVGEFQDSCCCSVSYFLLQTRSAGKPFDVKWPRFTRYVTAICPCQPLPRLSQMVAGTG